MAGISVYECEKDKKPISRSRCITRTTALHSPGRHRPMLHYNDYYYSYYYALKAVRYDGGGRGRTNGKNKGFRRDLNHARVCVCVCVCHHHRHRGLTQGGRGSNPPLRIFLHTFLLQTYRVLYKILTDMKIHTYLVHTIFVLTVF
jgi:hypothetical protein